ncbi:hypothetical protein [Labrys neptuniae]
MRVFRYLFSGAVVLMVFACAFASGAGATPGRSHLLRLGPLQIMCFRAPCPQGEMVVRPVEAVGRPNSIYRGPLPRLQAGAADAAAIRRAWQHRGCLLIEGALESRDASGATLRVSRIVRRC